ncbi:hypothetical protein RCCGE510_27421 (plasmid) [Rhizobium sp. CCGE 510]|nr:hypothetical protein RCCGE510_27421 [Rhizobium sp. CCGE 510]
MLLLHFISIIHNGSPKPVAKPKRYPLGTLVFSGADFHGADDGAMPHVAAEFDKRQTEPFRQFG